MPVSAETVAGMSGKRIALIVGAVVACVVAVVAASVVYGLVATGSAVVTVVDELDLEMSSSEDVGVELQRKFSDSVPAGYVADVRATCESGDMGCSPADGAMALTTAIPASQVCAVLLGIAQETSSSDTLVFGTKLAGDDAAGVLAEDLPTQCSRQVEQAGGAAPSGEVLLLGKVSLPAGPTWTAQEVDARYMLKPAPDGQGWAVSVSWRT